MSVINEFLNLLIDTVLIGWYGWVLFLCLLIWMLFFLRRQANNKQWVEAIQWDFLEVKIDELSEKSALAMEQVFAALHAIDTNYTFGEIFDGKTVLWVSCEMVSFGGKVHYIFKIPKRFRTLFESAVFAQYPKAEIFETEDYLKNLPHLFVPEKADFDFWGTEWLKKKPNAYPIRTFGQADSFEHSAQETFIDPLSNVVEMLSNIQPYELVVYQLVIKPIGDQWKEHIKPLTDKLKGAPVKHNDSWFWAAVHFVPDLIADILVTHVLGVEKGDEHARPAQQEPPSQMLHKTDVEKAVILAIERAAGKISYEVRIRTLYLAPKDKFNKSLKVPEIVGSFRNFDDINLSGIKPDLRHSWTDKPYKLSERLEKPYLDLNILKRKREILEWIRLRSHWRGIGKVIMNVEELASIFHFPQSPHVRVSQLEKVQAGKGAPPKDLPIG